jgi:hypothetical protein
LNDTIEEVYSGSDIHPVSESAHPQLRVAWLAPFVECWEAKNSSSL